MQREHSKARDRVADLAFGLREVWTETAGGVPLWDRIADQFEAEGQR